MNKSKTQDLNIKSKQRFVFKLIAVLLPLIILLLFEGLLRITGYGDNLNLFVQNKTDGYENYLMVNPEIGKKYFQKFEYTQPANDIFPAKKTENTFRIFVMGSSTVYGFPYERNLMFTRILNQQLSDAYPTRKIEIINTAITAINSFTLLDFTDEILKHQPDALLIYAGHNEFYGAFGIGSNETMSRNRSLTSLHILLMDFRIYQLLRNTIAGLAQKVASNKNEAVHGTLMKRMVAKKDILLNSEEYEIAMKRFRQNMAEVLKKAKKKNVPVFFSEVVSNLKGMEPFNSIADETHEAALDVFQQAKTSEKNGKYDASLKLYTKAKDLDCIRFRASEDLNTIINDLSGVFEVNRIAMVSQFQNHSPNKLIGNNLMTEHVHPNIDGIFLMADAFFSEIKNSAILGEPNSFTNYLLEYYKKNWGYTVLDSLLAHHRIELLKGYWPFEKDVTKEANYKLKYKPISFYDSLAFSALKNPNLSLAEIRLELARQYEKDGQIELAYREYEALLRINPYIAVNYRDAANCLLQLSDLQLALKYFQKSLEYEDSFFANFRIGEIYLLMGDYENAGKTFEKAFSLAPDDKKVNVLAKSYVSFVYGNKKKQADAVAAELKRVNASQYLRIPPKRFVYDQYIPFQTSKEVNTAKQLLSEEKNEEALEVLLQSLYIYNSPVANRLIGEIYLEKNNPEMAILYFSKIYDQFKFDPKFLRQLISIYKTINDEKNAQKYVLELKNIEP